MQRVGMVVRVWLHANGAGAKGNMRRRGTVGFWGGGRVGVYVVVRCVVWSAVKGCVWLDGHDGIPVQRMGMAT